MKKLILFLFLFLGLSLQATHILGGNISLHLLSQDRVALTCTYKVNMNVYRDCSSTGNSPLDQTAELGVFTLNPGVNLVLDFTANLDSAQNIVPYYPPFCFALPVNLCVQKGYYSATITLPMNNVYQVSYSRCCRASTLSNISTPGSTGFTISTILYEMDNSTPELNLGLPSIGFLNFPFWFDGSASEPDGDSILYSMQSAWNGNGPTSPVGISFPPYSNVTYVSPHRGTNPLGGNDSLSYDANNGIMYGVPRTQGSFALATELNEVRNGRIISSSHFESTVFVYQSMWNLTLTGNILIDSFNNLDTGRVEVYRRNPILDTMILIGVAPVRNGVYQIGGLQSTEYYVRAFPDSSSAYFNTHFPTYYRRSVLWHDVVRSIPCPNVIESIDITLLPAIQTLQSPGRISGAIENRRYPMASGLELYLMDEFGTPILRAITDNNGAFSFTNLPYGRYQLMVNLPNSGIRNQYPLVIDVTVGNSLSLGLNIALLTDRLQLLAPLSVVENHLGAAFQLFPNPTDSDATLRLDLTEASHITVAVQDYLGRTLQSKDLGWQSAGTLNESIQLSGLANGIYFVRVRTDKGEQVMKLVLNGRL